MRKWDSRSIWLEVTRDRALFFGNCEVYLADCCKRRPRGIPYSHSRIVFDRFAPVACGPATAAPLGGCRQQEFTDAGMTLNR